MQARSWNGLIHHLRPQGEPAVAAGQSPEGGPTSPRGILPGSSMRGCLLHRAGLWDPP